MSTTLNDEQRFYLIDLIREQPAVYDTRNPIYRDLAVRDRAWKEIAAKCHAQENACKIAWKSMRDQYQRYMRAPEQNKKRKFRYLSKLSFLEGFTKNTKKSFFSSNDDSIDYYVDNTSNSPKQNDFHNQCDDYHNYNETTIETIPNEFFDDGDQEETSAIPTPAKKPKSFLEIMEDPIYCKNESINSNDHEDIEDRCNGETENAANELFGTLSDLLTKRFQTEENENDLFLKMIGKKMRNLPILVQNSLQERFLKEVNDEIRKLSGTADKYINT